MSFTILVSILFLLMSTASTVNAQTVSYPPAVAARSQVGPTPIVLESAQSMDSKYVLMAASAARSAMAQWNFGSLQNFGMTFPADPSGKVYYLRWQVQAPRDDTYRVSVLLNEATSNTLQFQNLTTGETPLTFNGAGTWDKLDVGTVRLPAGISILELRTVGPVNQTPLTENSADGSRPNADYSGVKSVELMRASEYPDYQKRVEEARGDTKWFSKLKYGLFYQYGAWGYPNNVSNQKSLDDQANDFDIPAFVEMVKQSGAQYVIWSFSWVSYHGDMPVQSINKITEDPNYTARRNLIKEISQALKCEHIPFFLYYHAGYATLDAWWAHQNFPATFAQDGYGDKSTFFKNWKTVVADIGNTLGNNLDGFFFDDGTLLYYPAPFEDMEKAARIGNSKRLISWNGWHLPRATDFQDVWFGEDDNGLAQNFGTIVDAPVDRNGIFTSGPYTGLLHHSMLQLNGPDWGIWRNVWNGTVGYALVPGHYLRQTDAQLIGFGRTAAQNRTPLSLNLEMYEDGTLVDGTAGQLITLRNAIFSDRVPQQKITPFNDSWSGIQYGSGWTYTSNTGAGDYQNDVHSTTVNGASCEVNFVGTGITLYGPMSINGATAKVVLDGDQVSHFTEVPSSSTFPNSNYPKQHLINFSKLKMGKHTLMIIKTGGGVLKLDSIAVEQ
jgi:hypothetical protein